ncbi:MAG: glycosyltransferase family 4 protein [Caldilineaceae bacterium]|nr:glycosyltransferase family 4 protein [Caldilineaceae bacterium]
MKQANSRWAGPRPTPPTQQNTSALQTSQYDLSTKPIHTTFVMEQHLGHATFYQNLRRCLQNEAALHARWVEVTYQDHSLWSKATAFLSNHHQGILAGQRQVLAGLYQQPDDVVFFNTQVPAALVSHALRRRPYVLCTDITPIQYDRMAAAYHHQPDRNPLMKTIKHQLNRQLFRRATHWVPWSQWVRKSLIEDYDVAPERITVVPPGVDIVQWQPQQHTQSGGPTQILFVGGDFYRKGGELLLEAFRALPAGSAELVLVTRSPIQGGEGVTVRQDLQPNSPELIALYQRSDLFVLPTKAEAFGIAAAEAAAVGLPVIATNIGGVSDIVRHQQTGLLMQSYTVEHLRSLLERLIENSEQRLAMGRAARQHVETHFDAQKNARRILDLLVQSGQHQSDSSP